MTCITDQGLAILREEDEFKGWLQKIKEQDPNKSDEDIEKTLVSFMERNNGNYPGTTPFGQESIVFKQLKQIYDNDEVSAMEVYTLLFDEDFIKEFGNWCDIPMDTEGLTEEQIQEEAKEDQSKLSRSIRNDVGEPALFFVNSINHQAANSASAATNKKDSNLPFKIVIENGEARAEIGYNRPVQSGSITFIAAKNVTRLTPQDEEIHIDQEEVYKMYDFTSQNKGFTDKRLGFFLTQSSKDLYYVSKQISKVNAKLKYNADSIHNREEAVAFIRSEYPSLIFDDDDSSPFGCIQLMVTVSKSKAIWQIISPEGIFCAYNRYNINGTTMTEQTQTDVDRLANLFFIGNKNKIFEKIFYLRSPSNRRQER